MPDYDWGEIVTRVFHYYPYPSIQAVMDEPVEIIGLNFEWYLYDRNVEQYHRDIGLYVAMNSPKL